MSETELLRAFWNERSEEAYAELVRRYAGLVFSVARRRVPTAALAEDITQIVFIRFAQKPPKLQNQVQLAAWLHRTTLHVALDTLRSETRRRAREQQAILMDPAPNTLWDDISPKLDEALNELKDEDRQALLLRFFGRKSMRDIGAVFGVSEDAAKMRVSRAVDRLRTQLGVGAAGCTVAMLSTLLLEYSVEAAPGPLVSRLTTMRLPALGGVTGMRGLLALLRRISPLELAAGGAVLLLIGIGAGHLLRSGSTRPPELASESPTLATDKRLEEGRQPRPDAIPNRPPVNDPKTAKIIFHVLDAETGRGLAGTKVHYAFFGPGGAGESHGILTDPNGDATIAEPDDPTKNAGPNVFVTAEAHVPKVVGFIYGAVPPDYTIRLDPATTVGGKVVDEQGLSVSGVEILVQGPGNKPGQIENIDFQTCPVGSSEDGSWTCSYIPIDYTNEIRFILKKPGYAVTFPIVQVAQVNLTNLVLTLNSGFTITGQVTDALRRPINNAEIRIVSGDSHKRQSTRTDEQGHFTLVGLEADTPPRLAASLLTSEELRRLEELYNNLQAELARAQANSDQSRAVTLEQSLKELKKHSDKALNRAEETQPVAQVELSVQAKGFAAQTAKVDLLSATNVADVTMPPANIFHGHVMDEAGNPIPDAVVRTDFDFKNQQEKRFEWTGHTDATGWFEWDSAPVGEVCYWFEASGYKPIRGQPLSADGTDHPITLNHISRAQ